MMLALAAVLIGTVAPDWSGKTPDGRETTLSEVTRDRPAVVLTAPDPKWKAPKGVAVLIAPEAARLLGENKAALTDTGRVVRQVAASGSALRVSQWLQGRDIYAAQCLRCHGADGQDDHYPGIKRLKGIGRRISEAEIIERTIRSGSVDLSPFDEEARRALAVWVSGL